MTRHSFFMLTAAVVAALGVSAPATAQATGGGAVQVSAEPHQAVVAQLTAQGFRVVEIRLTLLGRLRILAVQGSVQREIVVSRSTGEVLRDVILDTASGSDGGASGSGGIGGGIGNAAGGAAGGIGEAVGGAAGSVGDAVGGLGL